MVGERRVSEDEGEKVFWKKRKVREKLKIETVQTSSRTSLRGKSRGNFLNRRREEKKKYRLTKQYGSVGPLHQFVHGILELLRLFDPYLCPEHLAQLRFPEQRHFFLGGPLLRLLHFRRYCDPCLGWKQIVQTRWSTSFIQCSRKIPPLPSVWSKLVMRRKRNVNSKFERVVLVYSFVELETKFQEMPFTECKENQLNYARVQSIPGSNANSPKVWPYIGCHHLSVNFLSILTTYIFVAN